MTIIQTVLTDCQQMLYGRRRIAETFYQTNPEAKNVLAQDIDSVSLENEYVICQLEDKKLKVKREDVLKNFWEHRTRTPSYFSYKIWMQLRLKGNKFQGWPIAALNYDSPNTVTEALKQHIGRAPRVSLDKDGTKRIYFVNSEEETCTCSSWMQLNENKKEIEKEFKEFTSIEFKPLCKHIQWYSSNLNLHTNSYHRQEKNKGFNPKICVYHYDHRHGKILYRVTDDGLKANGQWFPMSGWKEKQVYDPSGNPTGACWQVLNGALTHGYTLHPYAESVALRMQSTSKN